MKEAVEESSNERMYTIWVDYCEEDDDWQAILVGKVDSNLKDVEIDVVSGEFSSTEREALLSLIEKAFE